MEICQGPFSGTNKNVAVINMVYIDPILLLGIASEFFRSKPIQNQ